MRPVHRERWHAKGLTGVRESVPPSLRLGGPRCDASVVQEGFSTGGAWEGGAWAPPFP